MNKLYPNSALPIDPGIATRGVAPGRSTGRTEGTTGAGFRDLLQTELKRNSATSATSGLKFSAHAQQRLASRQINLGRDAMQRLDQAVARAAEKGAKDALMLMPGGNRGEDLAFVVSVTNRTVITAMDGEHITENVFTNIDSAVVVT